MTVKRAGILSMAFALNACAAAPNPAVDLAKEEADVRARSAEIVAAEAAKDVEAAVTFFLDDAIIQVPNEPLLQGRDEVHQLYTRMAALPYTDLSSGAVDVEVAASGDMAFEHGINRLTFPSPEGPWTDVGKYLLVWRKVNGQWRIAALSFSSDAPPSASAADANGP
jgi:uncharacterized protein (TIGR02246 family)